MIYSGFAVRSIDLCLIVGLTELNSSNIRESSIISIFSLFFESSLINKRVENDNSYFVFAYKTNSSKRVSNTLCTLDVLRRFPFFLRTHTYIQQSTVSA